MAKRIGYPIQLYRGHEDDLPLLAVGELAYTYNNDNQDKIWIGTNRGVNVDISKVSAINIDDIPVASQLTNGLMSKEDKTKLDGLEKVGIATIAKDGLMSYTDKIKLNGLNSDVATQSKDGLMSKADKKKLDSITDGGGGGGTSVEILEFTATIPATGWTTYPANTESLPVSVDIMLDGILPTDFPIVYPIYKGNTSTKVSSELFKAENSTWLAISSITTGTDEFTVYCLDEIPTKELDIVLRVIR